MKMMIMVVVVEEDELLLLLLWLFEPLNFFALFNPVPRCNYFFFSFGLLLHSSPLVAAVFFSIWLAFLGCCCIGLQLSIIGTISFSFSWFGKTYFRLVMNGFWQASLGSIHSE